MNADELAELVDRHAAALELFAARWTTSPEDCVQEALIELAARDTMPDQVAAWLFRVVRNRALNAARSARRRRQREQVVARLQPIQSNKPRADICDAAATSAALDQLAPGASEIIVLRLWSDLSFEEIAEVLDCSVSTAHRRYQRALAELRELLEVAPCSRESNRAN